MVRMLIFIHPANEYILEQFFDVNPLGKHNDILWYIQLNGLRHQPPGKYRLFRDIVTFHRYFSVYAV